MAAKSEISYFLFDCESVADGSLVAKTRYPDQGLSEQEAIRKFRSELLVESGRDFIPYTYHFPVAVVVAKVKQDLSIDEIVTLDAPSYRPHIIAKHFWLGWEKYNHPTLVTFNGRSFDVPLMELAAFRYGISVPAWFNIFEKSYLQNRNRYNLHSHIDLHEILTNFGSTWFRGGLNLAAQMLNKPGKMDVQGQMVQELFDSGKLAEINEYCRCDVLDTYFVFLRCKLLMGEIDLDRETELIAAAKTMIEGCSQEHEAYRKYLSRWLEWSNPWTDV